MKKKALALSLVLGMTLSLTACGSDSETIAQLNSMQSLGSENNESTNNYNISYTDQQSMIYAQVADRTLLDLSKLDACSENELQQTIAYMDKVDDILTGKVLAGNDIHLGIAGADNEIGDIGADEETISHYLTDYILTEFERTPYTWQRQKTIVRGIDAESRSIIVDVVYHTIGHEKDVKPDSRIVRGEPDYAKKAQIRFERYIGLLEREWKFRDGGMREEEQRKLEQDWKDWHDVYGDEETIIESQNDQAIGVYPSSRIYATGIQQTYTGLIDNEADKSGGTMTIRYILIPNYKLGINLGITCEHLYMLDYKLDKDITEGKEVFTEEGYATISDSINNTLYSYFQCIDESDYLGLYKLTKNFAGLDRYAEDVSQTEYNKHNNFTVSLFSVQGTHITCGVTVASKVRPRGSLMTYPNYTDRYYVELDLIGDVLKVSNMTLLSRTIEGEPAIKTEEADTVGFMAGFTIDNDDRLAIEDLICKFGVLQLKGDTSSDDFGDIVDLSMTTSNIADLKTSMTSLKDNQKKVVWIQNYQQGNANYASIKCKEDFQKADGENIVEATVTYDFIHKGGKWYIYKYTVNQQVRLDAKQLSTTGSLCMVSPSKVESYTSQVRSTENTGEDTQAKSDISVSYDHEEYTPVRKTPTQEEKEEIKETVKYIFSESIDLQAVFEASPSLQNIMSYDDFKAHVEAYSTDGDLHTLMLAYGGTAVCFYVTAENNGFASQEEFDNYAKMINDYYTQFTSMDVYDELRTADDWLAINDLVSQILNKAEYHEAE